MKKSPKSHRGRHTACPATSGGHPCSGALQPASSAAPPAAPAQTSCPGAARDSCRLVPFSASRAQCCSASEPGRGSEEGHQQVTAAQEPRHLGKSLHSAVEKPARQKAASPPRMKIQNETPLAACPWTSSAPPGRRQRASQWKLHLVPGKRLLSDVPNKSGPKKTMLKPRGCAGGLAGRVLVERGLSRALNTACASPETGRAKPSERQSISADSARSSSSQMGRMGLTLPRPSLKASPRGTACRQPEARGCGVDSGAAQGAQSISSPAPDPSPEQEALG